MSAIANLESMSGLVAFARHALDEVQLRAVELFV